MVSYRPVDDVMAWLPAVLACAAMRRALASLSLALLVACGGGDGDPDASVEIPDAMPTPDADPDDLLSTGLCTDSACTAIAADVHTYTPRWTLWSDNAEKRRWIWLPPGTKIDTADMNSWRFPIGTKLWKEFTTSDGVRVETRLLTKMAEEDWFGLSYVWNAEQTRATATPLGLDNANGTQHDVPSKSDCGQCHERTPTRDRVLGFSALHLDYTAPDDELDLGDLIEQGLLTVAPTKPDGQVAYFPFVASGIDERAGRTRALLGYLHTNCGHCHNPESSVTTGDKARFDVLLDVAKLGTFEETGAYQTMPGATAVKPVDSRTVLLVRGQPTQSILSLRFHRVSASVKMPPLATEQVDEAVASELDAWITSLPAR
jgi:hypothetical protein